MPHSRRDPDYSLALAEIALQQIRALRLPADPPSFEVWYAYASGHIPALNEQINAMLAGRSTLSAADIDQIYDRYFSAAHFADRVEDVGHKIGDEVDQIVAMIEATIRSTGSYHGALVGSNQKLDKPIDRETLRIIVESLVYLTKQVERENSALGTSLRLSRLQIEHLSEKLVLIRAENLTDPLTTLANRKHFDESLDRLMSAAKKSGEPLSLILCDVDHFKRLNDANGHLVGDHVLRLIALEMKRTIKGQDIAARYGGEEFAIILSKTKLSEALTVAENIRTAVMSREMRRRSTGESLGRVSVSVGVAEYRVGEEIDDLVARTDACLYEAKRRGRNCVVGESGLAR
jgi:diguanylate cyclase